jgi:hypothetical protein
MPLWTMLAAVIEKPLAGLIARSVRIIKSPVRHDCVFNADTSNIDGGFA